MDRTTKTKELVEDLFKMLTTRTTPYELKDKVKTILERIYKRKGEPER